MSETTKNDQETTNLNNIVEITNFQNWDILKFPQAEALVPLNPKRWISYATGSVLGQDLKGSTSLLKKPFKNIETAKIYLGESFNRSHYISRMTEVTTDTVVVNALAELGGWAGQALAGEYANQAAERYKNTMEKDYHENLDGHYLVKKKKLKSNFERHQVMVNKKLSKLDPIIGNAGPGNPSVSNFTKGSRPIWSRKWFTGGGKNAFINTPKQVFYVVVPTSQQTCLHQKQVEIIGHFSSLIIIFFIVIKKVSYRFKKLKTRISGYLKQIREGFVVCDETFIIL